MASFMKRALAISLVFGLPFALATSGVDLRRDLGVRVPFTQSSGIALSSGDTYDIEYSLNITLGGKEFLVSLDTGSSDLWVYAPEGGIKVSNDSHMSTNITYLKGSVVGEIQFAELKIGEHTIPSQAFINVQTLGEGEAPGTIGLMGISFDTVRISPIEKAIQDAWGSETILGRTVMSSIFAQNSSLQPSYDLLLNREWDVENGDEDGAFVIGYHDPAYAAVAQAPQIPRVLDHFWTGLVDGMKVNGQDIPLPPSSFANATEGSLVAVFDSGTSNLAMPVELVDAVHAGINGSVKVNGTWYLPCYNSANVSFSIGELDYPLHPLDLSRGTPYSAVLQDGTATTFFVCESSLSIVHEPATDIDMIFGDVFLKNVLTSFNFGPDSQGDTSGASGPFLQLLSLTDPDDAWLDFQLTQSTIMMTAGAVIDPVFLPKLFPQDFGTVENTSTTGEITPFPSSPPSTSTSPSPTSSTLASSSVATSPPASLATPSSSPASPTSASLSPAGPSASDAVAGAIADADPSRAASNADTGTVSLLNKYGPIVIGLLAANVVVMTLLCIIGLIACTRGALRGSSKMRSIAPSYAPVAFRDKQAADYDPEESAPIRSYADQ
ncbi:acid protease [Phanerochaete sordida]|uniref:Acid protease n=1 Tax=Phanerochaete sordida TaxID=48140 RepID=A0A9P3GG74_9APHY|nr:acid protease [Phanerochaete sordida]